MNAHQRRIARRRRPTKCEPVFAVKVLGWDLGFTEVSVWAERMGEGWTINPGAAYDASKAGT